MLEVEVPGRPRLRLEHLVLDFNGTLACDGELIAGVPERLARLADRLAIHVVTADTFGTAARALAGLPVALTTLAAGSQAAAKLAIVRALGAERSACVGNGHNDRQMLAAAALGIAVVQREGAAGSALEAAHIVCPNILDALDLLTQPLRIVATLRD